MKSLPSGAVTFLFTDIEGSTRLVSELRERYAEVLAVHQSLLREAFRVHGGHEIDTQGDAFFFAFANARDAVLAAIDAQRALAAHAWPEGVEVRVRIGLHTGQAAPSNGRFTGLAVHRAARISAAAHGGQVVVSQATRSLLQDEEEALGVGFRDLGEQRLKDLDQPVRLYQIVAPGLARDFPALRTVERGRRRRLAVAAVASLAVIGGVIGGVLATRSGGSTALTAKPNSVAVIDPGSNEVVRVIPVGTTPTSIAADKDAVWVLNSDEQTVSRLDAETGIRLRNAPVSEGATELAVGAHRLWVATNRRTVTEYDPQSTFERRTITLPGSSPSAFVPLATQLAADPDSVWASAAGSLERLAPPGGKPRRDPFCCDALTLGGGALWATDEHGVVRFEPGSGRPDAHIPLSFSGRHIAAGAGFVWVPDENGDKLWRVNPLLRKADDAIPVGSNPSGVAVGEGAVWVASPGGTVIRIDPRSDAVVKRIRVGGTPNGITVANGKVWVTVD